MALEPTGADTLAGALFTSLTTGTSFTVPAVDLTNSQYALPSTSGNPVHGTVPTLTEATLTSRTAGGSGLFDGLMVAMGAHLQKEFDKGRITGKEYAEAWVSAMQTAMGSAVQYALSKDQAYYQTLLVQLQAKTAEANLVMSRVALESEKAKLAITRHEANTAAANYALTKLKLATENAQFAVAVAQGDQLEYQVANLLPKELEKATAEIAATTAKTSQITYETANILPAQKAGIEAETTGKVYTNTNLLPAQLTQTQRQTDAVIAETSATVAKKDQILYETASLLPVQKTGAEIENSIKTYTLTDHLPAQVAGITADTAGKVYSNSFLLPAQLASMNEQTESHRAKTLNTRRDGTPVAGAIGKQMDLQDQQITSYKRDAEAKVAKMYLDTWITRKSLDEGAPTPTSMIDTNIDAVMGKVRTNLAL